jgi:hypothetical protein
MSRKKAWATLAVFIAQLGESYLAEIGVISHTVSEQAPIGVGGVFLPAVLWVVRADFTVFGRVLRDGLRAPWSDLQSESEPDSV